MNRLDLKQATHSLQNAIKAWTIANRELRKLVQIIERGNAIIDKRLREQNVIKFPVRNHALKLVQ